MKALIPAAGQGTRMHPATYAVSKEMLPVAGKPAIQHVVEEAIAAGIMEFVVVISPDETEIVEHLTREELFDEDLDEDLDLALVEQPTFEFVHQDEPEGLGDAILQARPAIPEDEEAFAVLYPDNLVVSRRPAIGQLLDLHEELAAGCETGLASVSVSHVVEKTGQDISAYSSIEAETTEREGLHRVHDVVEKPEPGEAPSRLAPIGRHVLTRAILEELEHTEPGHGGEIQLTDAIAALAREDEHYAAELEGTRLDVGNHAGFLEANLVLDILEAANREARADRLADLVEHCLDRRPCLG